MLTDLGITLITFGLAGIFLKLAEWAFYTAIVGRRRSVYDSTQGFGRRA